MANYWKIVNNVIIDADVLLLLLDARLVSETRNREIEYHIKKANKPLIYVITKCDLVDKDISEKHKKSLNPSVFISAKEHHGMTLLRKRILIEAKKKYPGKKTVIVGVLGYPNVGKSSLINALKGKKSASTSILSGHTRALQKVRADNRIVLLDTPGVIPFREKHRFKHALIGTIDFAKAKDPDLIIMQLIERFPGKIGSYYGIKENEDPEETIIEISKKRNILKKGAKPDVIRASRMILKDWQTGLIK